jgi:hypothetical protein
VVEHHLAKVGVAGSNPVVRSRSEGADFVRAHDFRTRSAFHDVMFLSELELDSYHYENRAEETRADREENFGSRPLAAGEVSDQGETGEREPCGSDKHTGRARRAHIFPQYTCMKRKPTRANLAPGPGQCGACQPCSTTSVGSSRQDPRAPGRHQSP